jgi:2,3-bisphosphoglycerate-independent phosphoglycerate mutase
LLVPPVEAKDRKHTGDPERVTIASFEVAKNDIKQYSEIAACKSDLNRIQRKQAMPLIMNLLGSPERIGV